MTAHHYTNSYVTTAQAAVNAGTCLEDANMANNAFATISQAVSQVLCVCNLLALELQVCIYSHALYMEALFVDWQGLISMDTVKVAVSQLFLVRMRLGEFDPPEMNPYTK